jgi:PhzF family phenazine biosynthesis protein
VPGTEKYRYAIRWFTPRHEAPFCGHATLAAAAVLFDEQHVADDAVIQFEAQPGTLRAWRDNHRIHMDFPAYAMQPVDAFPDFVSAFDISPDELYMTTEDPNYYLIYQTAQQVKHLQVDLRQLERIPDYGFAVSAPGDDTCDCVSRYFAPGAGIPEDPVTGSIHAALVPFWSQRLNRQTIHAYQSSARGGELACIYHPERKRVTVAGQAVLYMTGQLHIPDALMQAEP